MWILRLREWRVLRTTAEEQVELEEKKEDQHTALLTAEAGGDPPRNGLLGDW